MQQQVEFVQLEPNDDAYSIRDRLAYVTERHALLIWPKGGESLNKEVDLVLVQREAKRRNIQIAFLTRDPKVIQHARELKISTFRTVADSRRKRWKRGRNRNFIQRFNLPENQTDPRRLMEVASRVRNRRSFSAYRYVISRTLMLLLLLAGLAVAAYLLVPGGTVTVYPHTEVVAVERTITVDPDIESVNVEDGIIPANTLRITVETTSTIETTGSRIIEDVGATGTVIFSNETSDAVDIPINTTVSTSTGTPILFRTSESASLPAQAGATVQVQVEAIQNTTGSAGNVGTGLINTVVGPLESSVSVQNIAPMIGGASRTLPTVASDDIDRLEAITRQQLQSLAYGDMQEQLEDSQFIILETVEIVEARNDTMQFSHEASDISDTVSLSMRAIVEALAIDERFGRQVIFADISVQKPELLLIIPETFEYTRQPIQVQNSRIVFQASGSSEVRAEVDTEALKQEIAGISQDDAQKRLLNHPAIADQPEPTIHVLPNVEWFEQMPVLPFRINIEVLTES